MRLISTRDTLKLAPRIQEFLQAKKHFVVKILFYNQSSQSFV